jgi:hypothetical protein
MVVAGWFFEVEKEGRFRSSRKMGKLTVKDDAGADC